MLMVSGSDAHGTPITVRADAEGKSAQQIYEHYHNRFIELFQKIGLTYDLLQQLIPKITLRCRKQFSSVYLKMGICTGIRRSSGIRFRRRDSCLIGMWRVRVTCVGTTMPAAISVMVVETC